MALLLRVRVAPSYADDFGALTRSLYHIEYALILSLFAEFVLVTQFFTLALLEPFPTSVEIVLQVSLLLVSEDLFRS